MADPPGLMVRRTIRHELSLPAQMSIASSHLERVRVTASPGQADGGWIAADLVDFSRGGVGLLSGVFIPRMTMLVVRLLPMGETPGSLLLEAEARVQRVTMTDSRPAYLLGTSFEGLDDRSSEQVEALLALLEEDSDFRG